MCPDLSRFKNWMHKSYDLWSWYSYLYYYFGVYILVYVIQFSETVMKLFRNRNEVVLLSLIRSLFIIKHFTSTGGKMYIRVKSASQLKYFSFINRSYLNTCIFVNKWIFSFFLIQGQFKPITHLLTSRERFGLFVRASLIGAPLKMR